MIEYFKITEISDTYLSNELFHIIKNSNRLNSPIDYQKFISFIAVLVKGSRLEKLLLIFSIFGKGIPDIENLNIIRRTSGQINEDSDLEDNLFNSKGELL